MQPDVQSVGIDTVKAIASVVVQLPIKQQYWGIMHWKLEPALAAYAGSLSDVLPDFSREVAVQQAMSACGVSLPMHGSAAVGHGPPGLYTNWLFSEGIAISY
jgi:hypothetical protein